MKTYILRVNMYDDYFDKRFAFNANSQDNANSMAANWARYQGMTSDEVKAEETSEDVSGILRNEWISRHAA